MKIGILTSGGDCQALNAAMRGVALSLFEKNPDVKIIGFENGFKGLEYNRIRNMQKADFIDIINFGGTILGSSRTPFKLINEPEEDGTEKIKSMIENYKKNDLDCLVVLGGNGSQKTANLLSEKGLNVVSLPKTIDNDIFGTDLTFGYMSALQVACNAIECIKTTAESHSRIFIIEIMGHKTGWLTLSAGIAGGADVILLPEIPYDIKKIFDKIIKNENEGKKYTIIACAEGAISCKDILLSKKAIKEKYLDIPVSMQIASELRMLSGKDVRVTVPGHVQRGGSPSSYDRYISTRLGAAAADCIFNKKYGVMMSVSGQEIIPVPLKNIAGKLKLVPKDSCIIQQARNIGICFGD